MTDTTDIIELTHGDQAVGVVPQIGGGLSHWRLGGRHDLLRPTTADHLRRDGPTALACFPLVPYSNRIRDGRFSFEGREIRLPPNFGDHPHSIHGQGWQAPWQVAARDGSRVELVYRHAADAWPFDYEARQGVALDDGGMTLTLALTNLAERSMPAGLGFHPYFAGAESARITANVDGVWLTDDEVMPTAWSSLPHEWDLPAGVAAADMVADNVFTNWRGEAVIERADIALRLRLRAGPPLRHLVIFTPPEQSFFCVEPVSHTTDAVNAAAPRAETGLAVLAPGESLEATLSIALETL